MKHQYDDVSCLEEWLERKGWSLDLPQEAQSDIETQFVAEYADVRAALWERHYQSLDQAEREALDAGTHPSLNWDQAAKAESCLNEFRTKLRSDQISRITMSHYHGNTIVFTVQLNSVMHWREYRNFIPEFYRGFQVYVFNPSS
jgi:hypothetical protein